MGVFKLIITGLVPLGRCCFVAVGKDASLSHYAATLVVVSLIPIRDSSQHITKRMITKPWCCLAQNGTGPSLGNFKLIFGSYDA